MQDHEHDGGRHGRKYHWGEKVPNSAPPWGTWRVREHRCGTANVFLAFACKCGGSGEALLAPRANVQRLACESPGWSAESGARESGPSVSAGPGERARLSAAAGSLLDRWDDVCRREEPPRYESGLRAHGSNQRFHRLLGHAVARALTTAPSLTDLSPTAARILIPQGWRRKGPPGTLSRKAGWCRPVCGSITRRAGSGSRRDVKRPYVGRFTSNI